MREKNTFYLINCSVLVTEQSRYEQAKGTIMLQKAHKIRTNLFVARVRRNDVCFSYKNFHEQFVSIFFARIMVLGIVM